MKLTCYRSFSFLSKREVRWCLQSVHVFVFYLFVAGDNYTHVSLLLSVDAPFRVIASGITAPV